MNYKDAIIELMQDIVTGKCSPEEGHDYYWKTVHNIGINEPADRYTREETDVLVGIAPFMDDYLEPELRKNPPKEHELDDEGLVNECRKALGKLETQAR